MTSQLVGSRYRESSCARKAIWEVAPVAWLFQDNPRFFLQATLMASTVAGLFLAWLLQRLYGQSLFRENVAVWGDAVLATAAGELSDSEIRRVTEKLMNDFFG
jgi:hypothetical protein